MDKLILILFFAISALNISSQENPDLVLAKFKNGLFYVGDKIGEEDNIISLKINTLDTIHIDKNQISRYYDVNSALIYPNGKYLQTQGSFWDVSFGFNALGIFDSVDQRVSTHLEVIYGKRINENLNLGIGAGFEFNEAKVAGFQFDTQFLSLSAYGRYYLTNSTRRLFLFSRIGIGFPSEENENGINVEHAGGFNSLNGLGIHFASRKRSTFHISLGYYTQKTHGKEFFLDNIGNEIQTNFNIIIKRLMFKFGWEFG